MDTDRPKRVFISYSWTSSSHEGFVLRLAERLMSDGVDVVLDKWDLSQGQDKYHFMEKMVSDSDIDKVLVVSDKMYAEKADSRTGGVGTETQIITKDVYNRVDNKRFIPIVCEYYEDGKPCLPVYLRNTIYIDLSREEVLFEEYEKLIRSIFEAPANRKPKLGRPPAYILDKNQESRRSAFLLERFRNSAITGSFSANGNAQDVLRAIQEELEDELNLDIDEKQPLDQIIYDAIGRLITQRNVFLAVVETALQYQLHSVRDAYL